MQTINVEIPEDLARAAGWSRDDPSTGALSLLALELYWEGRISLTRAAEVCQMATERFVEFSALHTVPLHHGMSVVGEDRRMLDWLGL